MSGYFLPGGMDLVWIYLLRRSTAEKGVLVRRRVKFVEHDAVDGRTAAGHARAAPVPRPGEWAGEKTADGLVR